VYSGAVVNLRVDDVRTASGTVTREVVEHPGAVVIAALDHEGRLALARQYRHPVGSDLLELPAGGLEPGEDPEQAARRELKEEVGLEALKWSALGSFFSSPGFLREELHAFLATGLTTTDRDLDDDEDIEVVWARVEDLESGKIPLHDAKTLATLHLLRRHMAL
jgi:ADP-ribose pyrophosphatase